MICQPINPIEAAREAGAIYIFPVKHLACSIGNLPHPPAYSSLNISVKYPPIAGKINRDALFLAQQLVRFAGNCRTAKARDRYNNLANYELTKAYVGEWEHNDFWNQDF